MVFGRPEGATPRPHAERSLTCAVETGDSNPQPWSAGVRVLHWFSAFLIFTQIAVMFYLIDQPAISSSIRLSIHSSLGLMIFVLIFLRLGWRALTQNPRRSSSRMLRAGSLVHAGLYILIIALVTTGWLAYRPMPFAASPRLFGSLSIPPAPRIEGMSARDWALVHTTLVWGFLAFVGVHILAAGVHAFVLHDGTLRRMGFRSQEQLPDG